MQVTPPAGRPGLMARVQRQEQLHPPWGKARAAARHPPPPPPAEREPAKSRHPAHGHPPGLTLCQEFGHAALVALLAFLGLAGQLLVRRFQPLWSKGN